MSARPRFESVCFIYFFLFSFFVCFFTLIHGKWKSKKKKAKQKAGEGGNVSQATACRCSQLEVQRQHERPRRLNSGLQRRQDRRAKCSMCRCASLSPHCPRPVIA